MVGLNIKVRYGLKFSDKSWRNFKTNRKKTLMNVIQYAYIVCA